jgi:hypothetical protein
MLQKEWLITTLQTNKKSIIFTTNTKIKKFAFYQADFLNKSIILKTSTRQPNL